MSLAICESNVYWTVHHCNSWRMKDQNTSHQTTTTHRKFTLTLNHPSLQKKTTDVVIQQHSRKLLMMDILMSETCWAHKKWNKIANDIKLVFQSSILFTYLLYLDMSSCSFESLRQFSMYNRLHSCLNSCNSISETYTLCESLQEHTFPRLAQCIPERSWKLSTKQHFKSKFKIRSNWRIWYWYIHAYRLVKVIWWGILWYALLTLWAGIAQSI